VTANALRLLDQDLAKTGEKDRLILANADLYFFHIKVITMSNDNLEEDNLEEDKAREDKAREDKAREDKAREDKAREDKAREDKAREDKAREDKARDRKLDFKSTLLATLIGVFIASILTYCIAEFLNYKSEKKSKLEEVESIKKSKLEEVESIIKLLNIAKNDVDLNKGADKALEKHIEKANQKSDEDVPASAFEIYLSPGKGVPYPIVFEKVINDDRVLSYLSFTGLASLYRTQKALEEQRAYMMNPCITDRSCITNKLYVFDEYKLNLKRASDLLEEEIKYIRGESSEAQVFESYKKREGERYNLTEEQQENLLNFQ